MHGYTLTSDTMCTFGNKRYEGKKMMNYFKMLVSEIAVFKNFEIPCYTLNLSYFTLSTHPIAPVSQGDFLH